MQAGDLVRVKRDAVTTDCTPKGSVGLAVARDTQYSDEIFVYLFETGKQSLFLNMHLEIINASR
jgi:hypothetical protein